MAGRDMSDEALLQHSTIRYYGAGEDNHGLHGHGVSRTHRSRSARNDTGI